jgi:hypothetical protein
MFDSEDDTDPSSVDASAVIRGIAAEDHGNSNKGGDLAFLTKQIAGGGGAGVATERMRITSVGNVGIGATAPGAKLEVAGNIRATALAGGGNRVVLTDNNGTLYPTANLIGTGLGDNLGNHTATTTLNMNNQSIDNVSDIYAVQNYGRGLVGVYSSTVYQNVFSMGTSWRLPANGSTSGNLYGLAWTHSNVGGQSINGLSHQLLVMENGGTKVALGSGVWTNGTSYMPFIYDQQNTSYYLDANGTSRMSTIYCGDVYNDLGGWFRNYGLTGLYNQSYGNHWYASSAAYWNIGGGNGTNTGIIFRAGYNGAIQGYTYSDGSGFGLLHSGGGWNYRTWNGGQEMYGQTLAGWSGLYANIMYDRDNSGYYVDPHSNTYINAFQNNNTLLGWPGYNGMTQSYGNYVWPGRNDGSGAWWQQSWYLAGNSSYGLYTNTGMYFAGTTYHQNGGAFGGSAYNRDWGVGAGTTYGKVYSNWDNWGAGGLTISDDGGFYDYNDGWIQFQGSNGIQVSTSSASYFMLFRSDRPGCCYDKQIIPQNGNWGYVGTGGNYWYRMYAGGFVNASTRETKRDIMPLNDPTYELVMKDIDKIKPSFYKYHEELDELIEGKETKYRPNYHLGVITDESPDYIQDESFKGIDVYAIATLGIAGVKYNRAEIKEIKEAVGISEESVRIQDFGSFKMIGNEMTISFRDNFASKLNSNSIPVVTLTVNKLDVNVAISSKDNQGFTIIASGNTAGLIVDFMAVAEVTNSKMESIEQIPSNLMNGLVVDESTKAKIKAYWVGQKEALEASIVPGSKPDHIPSEGEHPVPHAADPNVIIQGPVANPDESVKKKVEEADQKYVPVPEDGPARGGYLPEQNESKHKGRSGSEPHPTEMIDESKTKNPGDGVYDPNVPKADATPKGESESPRE